MNRRAITILVVARFMAAPGGLCAADKGGGVDTASWRFSVEVPRPPKTGKHGLEPQSPAVGYLWVPDGVKSVRGLLVGGRTLLEKRICQDPQIRAALADEGMGALYFDPALDSLFDYVHRGSGEALEKALADLAGKSGHREIRFAPMLAVGHSTGGIFCRNVAYWKPERVIGVLHVMSGNLQDDIWDKARSLAGVPFLAINGEFEEFGPAGGDLKGGLRSEYSFNAGDKTKENQTQWVIVRQQLLDRRKRNPDNLMGLIVHRGQGHTSWDDDMSALAARFIRSAAGARLPKGEPDCKRVVSCRAVRAEDGWLEDADIKGPHFPPAPYNEYRGDKALAFWYPDKAMAEAVWKYHQGKWDVPDPTAGQSPERRFAPPPELRDEVDARHGKPPLEIVTATYFGTAGDGDLQGAAAAADGTLYVVGNTGESTGEPPDLLPGGVRPGTFGVPVKAPRCGHGFVAHLSADGKTILHYARFETGVALLTTVQANGRGVYVSGYASRGLEEVLKDKPGLLRQFPLTEDIAAFERDTAAGKEDKVAGRPGLGRYGAPCVLRLSSDLRGIEAGTYLEGWQQVWDKKRVAKPGKEMLGGYQEYFWQPTSTALLASGEVLVCHDGGYFRMLTDRDRAIAKGDARLLDRLSFYDTCDYVSKLSADLAQRAWKKPIYTPPTDPEVAAKVKDGWPLPHYSSPRTHRMRLDKQEHVYLCGWSASATSKEPWWSPYLYRLDPGSGDVVWKAYEYDPMSGGGNRMGGQVADTACVSLAIDEDGNLLTSLLADGGNTVMEWSPRAERLGQPFEVKTKGGGFPVHLVHWWGQVHRVDARTRQGLGGARIGPWGWAADVASLPCNSILALGRYDWKFEFTPDAWWNQSPVENPNAFLRVYSPGFDLQFSTSLPGVVPFEICRVGKDRYALVGRAEGGVSPVKDALFPKSGGKTAGYLMVLDWTGDSRH